MDAFLADDLGLVHFLHGIDLLRFLHAHAPHLSETSLADDVDAVEVVATHFLALRLLGGFGFFLVFEFGEVDFETVLHVPVGFLGDGGVAAVVLLLPAWGHFLALPGAAVDLRAARHHHARRTVDAGLAGLGGPYREWVEGFWWAWTGILMDSTLGRLPRCEFKKMDLEGMASGMECAIFLRKLLARTTEDFLDYSRLVFLGRVSLVALGFFMNNNCTN